MKAKVFTIFILGSLLIPSSLFANREGFVRLYPLPIVEVDGILSRWLMDSGFEVSRTSLQIGMIRLVGAKANESWEVILKPHSPLASYVQAQYILNGQQDDEKLETLWTYLNGYSKGLYEEGKNLGHELPLQVSSRRESVVCIQAKSGNKPLQFSGFFVDPKGFIVSTAHDLKDIEEIKVLLLNGREIGGSLVKIDPQRDLALIDIHSKSNPSVSPEKGRTLLGNGEKVYSIGCPNNHLGLIYSGIINGHLRQVNDLPLWQVEMEVLPGSSGSPVFDSEGNLVGVVKGRYRGTETVGFFIPLETVIEFLREK